MPAPLLIVGQGLAGTVLGRACERAGLDFTLVDAGHARASSRIGAGIINPVTGLRSAKSWWVDELLPAAVETYRELEGRLGAELLRRFRVRRSFRDAAEREQVRARAERGDLRPYVEPASVDDEGFWIEPAWRVDTARLIAAARARWLAEGRLSERLLTSADVAAHPGPVVWCVGAGASGLPLTPAAGSILEIEADGLTPDVIRNRNGRWLLPVGGGAAWVGATYRRGSLEAEPETEARAELEAEAARLAVGGVVRSGRVMSGVRMTTADRRPLCGWLPGSTREGCINGLGSKGALLAPWLAGLWVRHLQTGAAFPAEVAVGR